MGLLKAFEVLNHALLFAKLNGYGFSLKSTTFIQRYLNRSMQKVTVNDAFTAWEDIYSGMLQGSILVPLLSNNFINIILLISLCVTTLMIILYIITTDISTKFKNI